MYYKEIETSRHAKEAHDNNMRRIAGDRAIARAEWNRKNKPKKESK